MTEYLRKNTWSRKKLGELDIDWFTGINAVKVDSLTGDYLIPSGAVFPEQIKLENGSFIALKAPRDKLKKLKRGDVLFNSGGEGTLGRSALFELEDQNYFGDSFVLTLRSRSINPRLLFYILNLPQTQASVRKYTNGSTGITSIKEYDIKKFEIEFPSGEKEQDKIAEILCALDHAIEKTDVLIKKYERVRTGMMQDLFRYGIDEKGRMRSEKTHKFKKTRFGKMPEEWKLKKLKEILKISDGTHQSVSFSEEGIPFLFVSCVRDGEVKWDWAEKVSPQLYAVISKGKEPRAGMILYTVVGSYGHAALITDDRPFAFQRHIAYMFPNNSKVSSSYLSHWLNGDVAKTYAEMVALGNAQKTITLGDLGTFPVFLPEKDEQERISAALLYISNLISIEKNYRSKLARQKTGLMADLLTGTVRTIET